MKLLTEYLERAIQLEHLASGEPDSTFKKQLVEQAKAYRKLAAKRAKDYAPAPPVRPGTFNLRLSVGAHRGLEQRPLTPRF